MWVSHIFKYLEHSGMLLFKKVFKCRILGTIALVQGNTLSRSSRRITSNVFHCQQNSTYGHDTVKDLKTFFGHWYRCQYEKLMSVSIVIERIFVSKVHYCFILKNLVLWQMDFISSIRFKLKHEVLLLTLEKVSKLEYVQDFCQQNGW